MQLQTSTQLELLEPFANPVDDSQSIYRQVLKAMSEPGLAVTLVEAEPMISHSLTSSDGVAVESVAESTVVYPTVWAIAQTLLDHDCRVYVSPALAIPAFMQSLRFYTDCQLVDDAQRADFAFITLSELTDLNLFNPGTAEAPHQSTTLVVQTTTIDSSLIEADAQWLLSGPGIPQTRPFAIEQLMPAQALLLQQNHQLYPCGLDFIFCSPHSIYGLPRSTAMTECVTAEEVL